MTRTVLAVSPHPDDEALGAPGALLRLRQAGWQVVNVAWTLGSADQCARRRGELEDSCARLGFGIELLTDAEEDVPVSLSVRRARLRAVIAAHGPALVVAPSTDDRHPEHRRAAVATTDALRELGVTTRLWRWSFWGELGHPSLLVEVSSEHMTTAEQALRAHVGELERNDFVRALWARAELAAVLGAERVFGFGSRPAVGRWCEALQAHEVQSGLLRPLAPTLLRSGQDPTPIALGLADD